MSTFLRRLLGPASLCVLALTLTACEEDPPTGPEDEVFAEAEANVGQWTFIEVEGAQCRDGSDTGFGIRLQEGADDLVIYLEGGGACFNSATCAGNDPNYTESDFTAFAAQRGGLGIFSTAASNPVGDWNAVYVPYCTGDVHGGSAPNAQVPGVEGTQQFVGHLNIERYLALLAPYLDDTDKVLLTGSSAGGFGSLVNFGAVAEAFGDADPYLLDDSGPIFAADNVYSPQLNAGFNGLYNFAAAFPADAAPLFGPDGLEDVYDYYADRYPNATFGLASYLQDETIRFFFGFGQPDGTITGDEYAAGLRDLRAGLPDNWGTFYAAGNAHTFLPFPDRYAASVNGVAFTEWLGDLLDGEARDVSPDTPPAIAAR